MRTIRIEFRPFWVVAVICAAFHLTGCASFQQEYSRQFACRQAIGPEPDALMPFAFGLVGAAVMLDDPDHQAWQARVTQCVTEEKEAGR